MAHGRTPTDQRSEGVLGGEGDVGLLLGGLEDETCSADLYHGACPKIDVLGSDTIDKRPVGAPEIAQSEAVLIENDLEMIPTHRVTFEDEVVSLTGRARTEHLLTELLDRLGFSTDRRAELEDADPLGHRPLALLDDFRRRVRAGHFAHPGVADTVARLRAGNQDRYRMTLSGLVRRWCPESVIRVSSRTSRLSASRATSL